MDKIITNKIIVLHVNNYYLSVTIQRIYLHYNQQNNVTQYILLKSYLFATLRLYQVKIKSQLLYTEGKGKPKKEADLSRLAHGMFNKQGNLHKSLFLDNCRWADLFLALQNLKLYKERDFNWAKSLYRCSKLHLTLSRLCPWNRLPKVVTESKAYIPRTGGWSAKPAVARLSSPVSWWSHPLNYLLQQIHAA